MVNLDMLYVLQGDIHAMFLRHEGYLGAVGAFLKGVEEEGKHWASHLYMFITLTVHVFITAIHVHHMLNLYTSNLFKCYF